MLSLLNAVQLVLYIALLAMLGQAALHLLIGPARQRNVLYALLQLLAKPFVWPLNWLVCEALPRLLPALVRPTAPSLQRLLPVLSFVLVLAAYALVTFARMDHCVSSQLLGQPGCR